MSVTLKGLDEGVQALGRLRDAAGRFRGPMGRVGSDLIYAWGIETGFRQGGGVARKAGGAHYLQGGMEAIQRAAPAAFTVALPEGPQATDRAVDSLLQLGLRRAREIVPVRTGQLRGSIRSVPGRGL
jgi:hypothetical protein